MPLAVFSGGISKIMEENMLDALDLTVYHSICSNNLYRYTLTEQKKVSRIKSFRKLFVVGIK